jgi:hypothetical protein
VKDEGDAMGEVLTEAERVRRREHLRGEGGACAGAESLSLHRTAMHPETAEVYWEHGQICDPYDVEDLSEEYQCICRNYFVRSFRFMICRRSSVIAYGKESTPGTSTVRMI